MTYDIRSGTFLALILALVLNLVVFFIGRTALSVPFTVNLGGGIVTVTHLILTTIITTIGAGLILWILQRSIGNFVEIFLWLAGILALLSLIFVYAQAIGRPSFFSLGLMHIISVGSIVYGLLYFSHCERCEPRI